MQFVKDVETSGFEREVVERSFEVPVIVDFWAAWCGPCKVLGPMLERSVQDAGGAVELAKVDVDQNQQLAGQFGVQGIPTVIAFKDGAAVSQFTGALPEDQVREWIQQLIPSQLDLTVRRAEDLLEQGDTDAAEQLLDAVLAEDAIHQDAGVVMAGLHIDRGNTDEALALLARLRPTDEVQQLQAAARVGAAGAIDVDALEATLASNPTDRAAQLSLAKARAARGEAEAALEAMISIVEERGDESENARKAMLDVFEILGAEDPLVRTFRQRLASALF